VGIWSRNDPDARPARAAGYNERRTIVASAARVRFKDPAIRDEVRRRTSAQMPWQEEAWRYFDDIGEIKFALSLVASIFSRVRLYPGVVLDPEDAPTRLVDAVASPEGSGPAGPDEDLQDSGEALIDSTGIDARLAVEARDAFRKALATAKVSELCRAFALNLAVPGECYLALIDGSWSVRSTVELRVDTLGLRLQESVASDPTPKYLPEGTPVGRVWRPHPKHSADPDSSMRALRDSCEELLLLTRMIRGTARSQLNAGILFVPDEIVVASRRAPVDPEAASDPEQEDQFEAELIYSMTEPVGDEASASGVVPMLMRGPSELGDKIKHISLTREGDQFLVARADRVLDRILQGIDAPKDIVTGLANVKYANAIVIDESLYKAHIEPLALVLCDAITEIVLRPLLSAAGFTDEDVARIVIWYDPSEITVRPNRSADADTGYDKFLLSAQAWRSAHGFSDADAPDQEELARRLALSAALPDDIAVALLQALLPNVLGAARDAATAASPLPPALDTVLNGGDAPAPDAPAPDGPAAKPPTPIRSVPAADAGVGPVPDQATPDAGANGALPPRQAVG
jgi:hypothetical protein